MYKRQEFDKSIDDLEAGFEAGSKVATRKASCAVINAIAPIMPELWGGSADLGGSNNTNIKGAASFAPAEDATTQWPDCSPYGLSLIHILFIVRNSMSRNGTECRSMTCATIASFGGRGRAHGTVKLQ